MLVLVLHLQLFCDDVFPGKRQTGGNHVLQPNSGESPCDAHQYLDTCSAECNSQRGQYRHRRKEKQLQQKGQRFVTHPRLDNDPCKSLEVFSQCNRTDGKICCQCEYWVEYDVISEHGEDSIANGVTKLKQLEEIYSVYIKELISCKSKDCRVREKQVEY